MSLGSCWDSAPERCRALRRTPDVLGVMILLIEVMIMREYGLCCVGYDSEERMS